MANEIILLDTDFLIEYIYQNKDAVELITHKNTFVTIGATTYAEMIKGAINKEHLSKILIAIQDFHTIQIDEDISEMALGLLVKYHLNQNAALNDSLLAATALKYDCLLATCNIKHFNYIPNLQLLQHNVIPIRKKHQ
jgi:predicted nucleic acid-binding protein